jgi:ribosomal protein L14E/L6E/L27E
MKNSLLKKTLLVAILSLLIGNVIAQQKDVIYLKNGSVIKGKIIEFIPDQNIKIETSDGSIFVFKSSELVKMEKESAENNEADKSDVQQEVTIEPEKDSSNQTQERRLRTLPKAQENTGEPNSNPEKRTLSRYNSTPDYENIDIKFSGIESIWLEMHFISEIPGKVNISLGIKTDKGFCYEAIPVHLLCK